MAQDDGDPPPKRARLHFAETIEILVGTHKKSFIVHKDIICSRSPFFKAACERWNRERKPIELLSDEPETFDFWLQCAYSNTPPASDPLHVNMSFWSLTDAYILCDKLGDLRSANSIVDEIIRFSDDISVLPNDELFIHAWASTPENSRLRALVVDYVVHELENPESSKLMNAIPHDMLIAIVTEFRRLKSVGKAQSVCAVYWKKSSGRSKCHYHQHDETCPKCTQ